MNLYVLFYNMDSLHYGTRDSTCHNVEYNKLMKQQVHNNEGVKPYFFRAVYPFGFRSSTIMDCFFRYLVMEDQKHTAESIMELINSLPIMERIKLHDLFWGYSTA